MSLELRYHVPRSQVWARSGGRQTGNVHLHTSEPLELGRIRRRAGAALCGRDGWYERTPDRDQVDRLPIGLCPRCVEIASRMPDANLELEAAVHAWRARTDANAQLVAKQTGTYKAGE